MSALVFHAIGTSAQSTDKEMTKYHAGTLIERVNLDFLGPLPQLGSEISMFWSPSKWIASPYPLRWQMSLPRPQQIFTDQGCNFKNENCL